MAGLIPRGSLGLKLLLVCLLVLAMGIPLLLMSGLVLERQGRAREVTAQIGQGAGGQQVVGGPMLLVPYTRVATTAVDRNGGVVTTRTEHGAYLIFAETGAADAQLRVQDRRLGIYRAAIYTASTDFTATFKPAAALADLDSSYQFDWSNARVVMFARDSRAIRNAAQMRFGDGSTVTLEPVSDLGLTDSQPEPQLYAAQSPPPAEYQVPAGLQAFAAPAPLAAGPRDFSVETRVELTGSERFSIAAFAQDTTASIRGDRRDVRQEGFFQAGLPLQAAQGGGFLAQWHVPFVARGMAKASPLAGYDFALAAQHDMAVSFVSSDDVYIGVQRAIKYGVMFIGIVFLATLIFEAISGRRAHPAQYILVGLAQCVFYLLLLAMTEVIGFTVAFEISAAATVLLLAYYAGSSSGSLSIGARAFIGLSLLYAAMYALMTLEDLALLVGAWVAFLAIAATLIATRHIDWYGRSAHVAAEG